MLAVPVGPIDVVVAVVNEYGTVAREIAGESELPYPTAGEVAVGALESLGPGVGDLRAAADTLHPVFAAAAEGGGATELNAALAGVHPHPCCEADGSMSWAVPTREGAVGAALTLALLGWVDQHGLDRLGVCAAERCADVYADVPGRRRFCSSTCLSRTKVAAHRRRRAADLPKS